jgi:hypothetical protein
MLFVCLPQTLSLEHRRLYLDLMLMYKIVHGLSSLTMRDIGLYPVQVSKFRTHGYNINSSFIPVSSLSLYCFSFHTCKLWNVLPKSLFSMSFNGFKINLLKLDLPALARGYVAVRCVCC